MFHQSPKHEQSTPTLSKVTESYVIEKDLKLTLLKSMDPQQYGFLPRSCTTFALLSMVHHWLKSIDGTGSKVRVSLPDYREAFDLVDHNLLTAKLFSLGVKPSVVNWIIDFLRVFREWKSVLEATLISNSSQPVSPKVRKLTSQPTMSMWKFADDTTISEVIPKGDQSMLQEMAMHFNWML